MSVSVVELTLIQQDNYRIRLDFGDEVPALIGDEPPPLGQNAGPAPQQLLLAAVANCLVDSLHFALGKYHQNASPLRGEARAILGRNEHGRLRVQAIEATLRLGQPAESIEYLDRILGSFEDFCTVSQSVGRGIPTTVQVLDTDGRVLK
ncbi:OsmC family protein [Neisseriaceae bacterium JH1-16]|nr:OsmC family protein [Neisseriaceae bacterium JH1-16]